MNTLNPYNVQIGERYIHVKTGKEYEVTMIAPAGGMGISEAAGARVTLRLIGGQGYTRTAQYGALDTPMDFERVVES